MHHLIIMMSKILIPANFHCSYQGNPEQCDAPQNSQMGYVASQRDFSGDPTPLYRCLMDKKHWIPGDLDIVEINLNS